MGGNKNKLVCLAKNGVASEKSRSKHYVMYRMAADDMSLRDGF